MSHVAVDKDLVEKMISQGYRKTSGKFGIVSRIDRADWKSFLAFEHTPWDVEQGMAWVECLGDQSAEDHYRRCYSPDQQELGRYMAHNFPTSGQCEPVGYLYKEGDKV